MFVADKWYTPIIYILFLSASGWLIGNVSIDTSNHQKVTPKAIITDYTEYNSSSVKTVFDTLDSLSSTAKTVIETSLDSTYFDGEAIESDHYANQNEDSLFFKELMSNAKTYNSPVKKAIIRYYVKKLDQEKVRILERYGFYIHDRPSALEETHPSNALYLGDSISNHDVLLVTYALLQQGIAIKYITESKGHDGWKANAIEVVTDTTVINDKIISLRYLRDHWSDI